MAKVFLKETTKWPDNTPNHTYILEDINAIKMIGYIPQGEQSHVYFSRPFMFDRRSRSFSKVSA